MDTAKLKSFCERVSKKVTVFVDEAYIDYLPDPQGTTLIPMVNTGANIIVPGPSPNFMALRVCVVAMWRRSRIRSKNYLVYGGVDVDLDNYLTGGYASYQDREFLDAALKKTIASKEYLYSVLKKEGYDYVPSSANFVLFPIKMDGKQFADEMMKRV